MLGVNWRTSEKKYKVKIERDVAIPMSDGVKLYGDVFRPDTDSNQKFPAILGISPYSKELETAPLMPQVSIHPSPFPEPIPANGHIEDGDPNFYVKRGYAQVIVTVRGTGKSEGSYMHLGPKEATDGYEVVEWVAKQPWCDGNVGMFGVSYFAMIQFLIAALNPPHLKCIFSPWGTVDVYRDVDYQGGILNAGWVKGFPKIIDWPKGRGDPVVKSLTLEAVGQDKFNEMIKAALEDDELSAVPYIVDLLKNPNVGSNPYAVDVLLHKFNDDYWKERCPNLKNIKVPSYLGCDWGPRIHLPSAFECWENISAPKKMLLAPLDLDRPVFQLMYESLRWFDYWLKGNDTGIMKEAPLKFFIPGTGEWKEAKEFPLPETRWTPFYLHERGLLSEHEPWENEGSTTIFDSPWRSDSLDFYSPRFVENTEVLGYLALNLFASSTDTEALWFITMNEVDANEKTHLLTRGWLRGTHREIDQMLSKPWLPYHPHSKSEPLEPNKIYEFKIGLIPTCRLFKVGTRMHLRVRCSDPFVDNPAESNVTGHLIRQKPSRVTVYHNEDYPSNLLLPITKGNLVEMYISTNERSGASHA